MSTKISKRSKNFMNLIFPVFYSIQSTKSMSSIYPFRSSSLELFSLLSPLVPNPYINSNFTLCYSQHKKCWNGLRKKWSLTYWKRKGYNIFSNWKGIKDHFLKVSIHFQAFSPELTPRSSSLCELFQLYKIKYSFLTKGSCPLSLQCWPRIIPFMYLQIVPLQ